jgi:hypothetical protein
MSKEVVRIVTTVIETPELSTQKETNSRTHFTLKTICLLLYLTLETNRLSH